MDIDAWLRSLGLDNYSSAFREHRIDAEMLLGMSGEDLKELGVTALGDRKRLLAAIAAMASGGAAPASAPSPVPPVHGFTAERRQLTVMFCDLVGSTALSRQLDPEDLQELIRSYHGVVTSAVEPFDGRVAQFLGDGVLVYFGYPRAHEDDAERAVRAALNVLTKLAQHSSGDTPLQTRIGIATGRVVVGEIGAGTAAAERSASGETPNLAARLQSQAKPGEIIIADETRQLVGESFKLDELNALELKGFAVPVRAWRVQGQQGVQSRFEAQRGRSTHGLVGREGELAQLLQSWEDTRGGVGAVVLLGGEAGIGKSRMCQALRDQVAVEAAGIFSLQCSPYFTSSAFYPVVQELERAAGMDVGDGVELRAQKLEHLARMLTPTQVGGLLRLMGLPDGGRPRPGGGSPQEEKTVVMEALTDLLAEATVKQPVLCLAEDAHWIDPSTEELIARAARLVADRRLMLLVTSRPEYQATWLVPEQVRAIVLARLLPAQCEALIRAVVGGKDLPREVVNEISAKTDGVPLFVEELTRTVLQSGLLEEAPSGYRLRGALTKLSIPATLQDLLMARLDQLSSVKEVAQVGAVIGRDFTHGLLADVLTTLAPTSLDMAMNALVDSELVFRRGTPPNVGYSFKHALVRDTAYASMVKSQRALRHQQVADALERRAAAGEGSPPELMAYHHQEGGHASAALKCWRMAGDAAMARSALREAVSHYEAAIATLRGMPDRDALVGEELGVCIWLGHAAVQLEGYASSRVAVNFARAREIADALDLPDAQGHAYGGIADSLNSAARYREVVSMLETLRAKQFERMSPMSRVSVLIRMGFAKLSLGELAAAEVDLQGARRQLEDVKDEERQVVAGGDPQVVLLMHLSLIRRNSGRLDSAQACVSEALEIAEQRQHLMSRLWAIAYVNWMAELRGDVVCMKQALTYGLELAERYNMLPWIAAGRWGLGRLCIQTNCLDEGMRLARESVPLWAMSAGRMFTTPTAALTAETLLEVGANSEAEEFVAIGEATSRETDEHYHDAQLRCLRARLDEAKGDESGAMHGYREAMEIAERQGARMFTLQAATELARLTQAQGHEEEADDLLRPIYDQFTDGFEYLALKRAKAVLERSTVPRAPV